MISVSSNDYVIVQYEGRNKLILVSSVRGDVGSGFVDGEENEDGSERAMKFGVEQVVANLGARPVSGSVYGIKVEPLLTELEAPGWGTIKIHRPLELDERKVIGRALNRTRKLLERKGLFYFTPVEIEIRPKNGKYAGFYKTRRDKPAILCLKPQTFNLRDEEIDLLILHEAAHGTQEHASFPLHLREAWIKLFQKRVVCKGIKQKTLDSIRASLKDYGGTIKDYMKDEAADDTLLVLKECVSHIKRVHRLDVRELDILLLSKQKDSIDSVWPVYTDLTNTYPDISEYALVNPSELYAECFSMHLSGITLPKDVRGLLKETMREIRQL